MITRHYIIKLWSGRSELFKVFHFVTIALQNSFPVYGCIKPVDYLRNKKHVLNILYTIYTLLKLVANFT